MKTSSRAVREQVQCGFRATPEQLQSISRSPPPIVPQGNSRNGISGQRQRHLRCIRQWITSNCNQQLEIAKSTMKPGRNSQLLFISCFWPLFNFPDDKLVMKVGLYRNSVLNNETIDATAIAPGTWPTPRVAPAAATALALALALALAALLYRLRRLKVELKQTLRQQIKRKGPVGRRSTWPCSCPVFAMTLPAILISMEPRSCSCSCSCSTFYRLVLILRV